MVEVRSRSSCLGRRLCGMFSMMLRVCAGMSCSWELLSYERLCCGTTHRRRTLELSLLINNKKLKSFNPDLDLIQWENGIKT